MKNSAQSEAFQRRQRPSPNVLHDQINRLRDYRLARHGWDWWPPVSMSELLAMTPKERGDACELTFQEQVARRITMMRSPEIPEVEQRKFFKQRRREQQRIAKRVERERLGCERQAARISPRGRDLLNLIGPEPQEATWLTERASSLRTFRKPNGRRNDGEALRRAVHRRVDELVKLGLVEDRVDVLPKGKVRWVWKPVSGVTR